jgi:hypothetical protein
MNKWVLLCNTNIYKVFNLNVSMKYKPLTVKLEKEQADRLKKVCNLNKKKVSTFMREAIISKLEEGAISHIAGENEIDYNPENDKFIWKIKLDEGKEIDVLRDISFDFVEDLFKQLDLQIKKREELLGKKNKKSVSVPKGLIK